MPPWGEDSGSKTGAIPGVGRGARNRIQAIEKPGFGCMDQSEDRIAHRSGKIGVISVVSRYCAPAEPPVPGFEPIVRWTIFTWR